MYPNCHKPKDRRDPKVNCGTCSRYNWAKSECGDEIERHAEWGREHKWAEKQMQQNRGVYLG